MFLTPGDDKNEKKKLTPGLTFDVTSSLEKCENSDWTPSILNCVQINIASPAWGMEDSGIKMCDKS